MEGIQMRGIRSRSLVLIGTAAVTGLALASTGVVAGTAASPAAKPNVAFLTSARTAFAKMIQHERAPLAIAGPKIIGGASTFNWSGYADTSTTTGAFTQVAGTWTVPKVTCSSEDQILSSWVGLDGANTSTVEQLGTYSWCYENTPLYYTWYEMYPHGTVEESTTLQPGDTITASVVRSSNKYTLTLTDSTHSANSFTVKAKCMTNVCLDRSAEWIAERPDFSTTGYAPLANYGTWNVTDASVTSGGTTGKISSFNPEQVTMIDSMSQYALSTPSSLSSGTAFTTTWLNSY
jgi:hypothetical protein